MGRIIYHIEDRANGYIYHWLFFMISGFRYILIDKPTTGNDGLGKIEQNIDLYLTEKNKKCYNIYFSYIDVFLDYQKESLEILKNTFNIIKKNEIKNDDIIINNYGEQTSNTIENLNFLKDLFLSRIDINLLSNKFNYINFYIKRGKSHNCEGNKNENYIKRRHILNEEELCIKLELLNIKCIYLEDYCFIDKINLFKNAKNIISPNSGGLSMLIFCDPKTNLIEINTINPHQISNQYENICLNLKLSYYKYTNVVKNDHLDNMTINTNEFIEYVSKLNII